MKIAVMGAGGVGAYVGARLQVEGEQVAYIARGLHLAAMQSDGLRIESPAGNVHLPKVEAREDPARVGTVDLVLFTVKLWDTESAAHALAPLLAPHTRVVTLQNGIDSVEMISRHVPRAQVVGGVIYVSAVISRPGVITSPGGFHRIIVDAAGGDQTVAGFCQACQRAAGIEAVATDAIDLAIWEKFITLAAISGATALLRASTGPILGNPETREFLRQLIAEGVAVAQAAGHAVSAEFTDTAMSKIAVMPPTFRSSMAEDLESRKPLELKWLSGRIHGLGLQYRVPTPGHSAVYRGLALYADGNG
ncbi:MAG: 2-dehydropantoate 2-reductase [Rudaea sp.]|nr:2-dehydropantoate 2-reductase [Rudaea sp.]